MIRLFEGTLENKEGLLWVDYLLKVQASYREAYKKKKN